MQFQVRRESKNKGRWFYTCQKDRTKGAAGHPDKCDFFLWAEDARLREEGALFGRRRGAEPPTPTQKRMRQTLLSASVTPRAAAEKRAGPTPVVPLSELERQVGGGGGPAPAPASSPAASSMTVRASGSGRTPSTLREIDVETDSDDSSSDGSSEDELAPGPTTTTKTTKAPRDGPPQAGDKRKREEEEDDDDYGDWSSSEEQQLAAITDSSSHGPGAQGRKRDAFATPAAARTHDVAAGLPTPSFTNRPLRRVLFTEPEASTPRKRQRTTESTDSDSDSDSDAALPTSNPPPKAPQPQLPSVATTAAAAATTPGGSPGITAVVMGLLRDQKVDGAVRARVRQELERCEARARGLERGRDAARQAVQKLEARAAQQQQRIVVLENERHLHAEAREKMRTRLMKLCSDD